MKRFSVSYRWQAKQRFSGATVAACLLALLALGGCAHYRLGSDVPDELRTIAVPVFENATGFPEIDALVTQYLLREFQREGTFKIKPMQDASLKLLGKLSRSDIDSLSYDRSYGTRTSEYRHTLIAKVTLVERGSGKLLLDDVSLKANTTFLTHGDMLTGLQDAGPRIARELARMIVDAVLAQWAVE